MIAGALTAIAAVGAPAFARETIAPRPEAGGELALSLEEAVELAELANSRIERAQRSARIAELQVKSARAAYYPRVDISASANQSARGSEFRTSGSVFRQSITGAFHGGVTLSANVPIDISGIIARRVRSSRIGEDVAGLELARARTETIADTQIAYLNALRAQRALELDRQMVASITNLMERAPRSAQQVVAFLGLELASARQVLGGRQEQLEQALDALKRLLDLDSQVQLSLTSALPDADKLKALAAAKGDLESRNDLEIARRRLEQTHLSIKQSEDHRRPSITAGVNLDQSFGGKFVSDSGETSSRNYGLNLSLRLPILNYDAGQSGNSRKIAELMAEQARDDLKGLVRQAENELKQAQASFARALERTEALPNALDAALALAHAERNLLAAPAAEAPSRLAQVSNARSAWRSAEAAAGDAAVELAIAAIRLRRTEGRIFEAADFHDRSPTPGS